MPAASWGTSTSSCSACSPTGLALLLPEHAAAHHSLHAWFCHAWPCRLLQIRAQSEEDADDELLSVAVVKGGRKLVAGAQSGVLNLFSWGHFRDCSDRFPGEP